MEKLKVVFHIDGMTKWKLTLTNVSHLIVALKDQPWVIEIVANSEAVNFYLAGADNAPNLEKINVLVQQGVTFIACNNALKVFNIDPTMIFSNIVVVPAGVAELVYRQHEGFAYIKP